MTDKPFDPTKPVRTRAGRPARIICADRAGEVDPIVALVREGHLETIETYRKDGRYLPSGGESDFDLINSPERHVRWVNIYDPPETYGYLSRKSAEQGARDAPWRCIACIRIEFEEGEGL